MPTLKQRRWHSASRATLFVVGWTWDHRYVPLLFAAALIVALAGLVIAAIAVHRDHQVAVPALIGGALSLLVLLGDAYALLAYASGGN